MAWCCSQCERSRSRRPGLPIMRNYVHCAHRNCAMPFNRPAVHPTRSPVAATLSACSLGDVPAFCSQVADRDLGVVPCWQTGNAQVIWKRRFKPGEYGVTSAGIRATSAGPLRYSPDSADKAVMACPKCDERLFALPRLEMFDVKYLFRFYRPVICYRCDGRYYLSFAAVGMAVLTSYMPLLRQLHRIRVRVRVRLPQRSEPFRGLQIESARANSRR